MRAVRTLVLVSWDGRSVPLAAIRRDAVPAFDIALFDYSGSAGVPDPGGDWQIAVTFSQKTECKGQIFSAFHAHLESSAVYYDYVALFDDDIAIEVSALNGAIALAAAAELDSFSLSLTPDSHVNHRRFVQRPGGTLRPVPWVEVMMPFYRRALFMAASPFFSGSISSYGIDQFVMPMIARTSGSNRVALVDRYAARHCRPVTSDGCRYANGLTAHQERVVLRRKCLDAVSRDYPRLLATRWFYATFAAFDGPVRFWLLYLAWPRHAIMRLASGRLARQIRSRMRNGEH